MLELSAGTWDGGAGSQGCGDTRVINPFRDPTLTTPGTGAVTFRGGVGYCVGQQCADFPCSQESPATCAAGDTVGLACVGQPSSTVISACSDTFHLAPEITLTAGAGAAPTPAPPATGGQTVVGPMIQPDHCNALMQVGAPIAGFTAEQ